MSLHAVKVIPALKAATWLLGVVGAAVWMTDPSVKVAVIASVPATVTGIGAIVLGFINKGKIKEVHLTMNSRLDELLHATKVSAHDAGRREGIESEQARMRPADLPPPKKGTP